MTGLKFSTLAWISLDEIERTMTYISFIFEPCDLKFGLYVVKTLFYFMKPVDYTYYTHFHTFWFFRRWKRVGSVLSRWELDPFLYIWYHTVRTQSGLSPCEIFKKWNQEVMSLNPSSLKHKISILPSTE